MNLLKQKFSTFALVLNLAILGSLVPRGITANAAVNVKKLAYTAKKDNVYKVNKPVAKREQKKAHDEFEQAVKETEEFLCSENCLEKGIDNPQYAKTAKIVGEQIEERLNNGKYGEENSKEYQEKEQLAFSIKKYVTYVENKQAEQPWWKSALYVILGYFSYTQYQQQAKNTQNNYKLK